MIRLKDVAKNAGVSTATVSHVINKTRFVSKETERRVRKAMEELNYLPNLVAKSLRNQKSMIIGFLVPDISNLFFTSVLEGIQSVLNEHGYQLIVSNSNEDLTTEVEQLKMFWSQQVSGLILASTANYYSEIEASINKQVPLVFIDRIPKGIFHDFISAENEKGTYKAISYLINKGYERIGIIAGIKNLSSSIERVQGYRMALKEHGIQIDENLIKWGDSRLKSGYRHTKALYEETDINAIFVANNLMTIGALTYLKERNINIPKDIALVGFDDYEWALITNPPLTVIKQPPFAIGERAAQQIIKQIKNEGMKPQTIRFPTELVIRNSC